MEQSDDLGYKYSVIRNCFDWHEINDSAFCNSHDLLSNVVGTFLKSFDSFINTY
jgi:hypothetical protein